MLYGYAFIAYLYENFKKNLTIQLIKFTKDKNLLYTSVTNEMKTCKKDVKPVPLS